MIKIKNSGWIGNLFFGFLLLMPGLIVAQEENLSERMASTVMNLWPDSMALNNKTARWTYEQGLVLKGIEKVWKRTGDGRYFEYIKKSMDYFVRNEGKIRTYELSDYNIDQIMPGRNLLMLYSVTGNEKYFQSASLLRSQIKSHPRNREGGFWHKQIYPDQMWLDGLYMAEPFYAEYAKQFNEPDDFDDIAKQFILMEKHTRDPNNGLLYHGWDEGKQQRWSDKNTGSSPNFWGRAMGWYGMALVDVLDYFPQDHPQRKNLIEILERYTKAILSVQDANTGLWYQVLDKAGKEENYLESSASCMFVYILAKAVRMGYLDEKCLASAKKAYNGILKNFISMDEKGNIHLNKICQVAGLGGDPYRDASFEYYVHEPVVTDDPKGLGAFLLASVEMEIISEKSSKQVSVTLDYYFNNERRKNAQGQITRFHYIWDEYDDSGLSLLGNIFSDYGAKLSSLELAPTQSNLNGSDIYIIVDPDGLKDNPNPNYIEAPHIKAITDWVKDGGTLVLMANDSANCDLIHTNKLASVFGITFTYRSRNMVKGNDFETGAVDLSVHNEIFKKTKKAYLKEISILEVSPPAKALISKENDVIMAVSKYGKGIVFAVGDPWLYNEYIDGRKLPAEFENFQAAKELVKWLIDNKMK